MDFAGPLEGKMYLIAVDAFSKWPEVVIMDTTTTSKTIDALRDMFARWGLPHQLVKDNGPQFTSIEFENFIKSNGVRSAPYHQATNWLAKRLVQSFKQALHVSKKEKRSLIHRVATFLFQYRNAAHATTEIPPAELMIGHMMRNQLDLLRPDLRNTIVNKQTRQVMTRSASFLCWGEGDGPRL